MTNNYVRGCHLRVILVIKKKMSNYYNNLFPCLFTHYSND